MLFIILQISDGLKLNGYKAWIDVEQMEGSTLQAMAEAVENSCVVLVCISERYKDSPNCRSGGYFCV
jgi:male-specific lethal 1